MMFFSSWLGAPYPATVISHYIIGINYGDLGVLTIF